MSKEDFEQFRDRWDLVNQHEKATETKYIEYILEKEIKR